MAEASALKEVGGGDSRGRDGGVASDARGRRNNICTLEDKIWPTRAMRSEGQQMRTAERAASSESSWVRERESEAVARTCGENEERMGSTWTREAG